ncbi:hypothetical protein OEZ86_002733 [Tetradesmus obliquus]|nr:hypothetical protein OEZ86_002733 [Tetradesmus obliquus]
MQHRLTHRLGQIHYEDPILPIQERGQTAFRLSYRQLQRGGTVFALLLVLFVVHSYRRHYQAVQRQALSSCPARLAALGLDLSQAAHESARFVTSSDDSSSVWQHSLVRQQLYREMAAGLKQHGLSLGGVVTQGLTQSQLFTHADASSKWGRPRIMPVLHPLQVPVRAVVLPLLDHEAVMQLHAAVRHALQQVVADDSVWYQDDTSMHATLYHASTHGHPVPAAPDAVRQEIAAVRGVAGRSCPVRAVLDRVVVTSTGVVVACWQVLPGSSEPAGLRSALKDALPAAPAPAQQVVLQPSLLHITVARLLAPAKLPTHGGSQATVERQVWHSQALQQALAEVAADLTDELCGLVAVFEEVWFVEEQDLLALGLGGRYAKHAGQLSPATLEQAEHIAEWVTKYGDQAACERQLAGVMAALPQMQQLRNLVIDVHGSGWLELVDPLMNPLSSLTNLTRLEVGSLWSLGELQHTPHSLLELEYSWELFDTPDDTLSLSHLTALTKLTTGRTEEIFGNQSCLPASSQLRVLHIEDDRGSDPDVKPYQLSAAAVAALGSLTALTSLQLHHLQCPEVQPQQLAAALRRCTALQVLDLGHLELQWGPVQGLTGDADADAALLDAAEVRGMQVIAVGIASLPSLQQLALCRLPVDMHAAVALAAAAAGTRLTELSMDRCDLPDCAMSALALGLTNLRSLELKHCDVGDGALPALARLPLQRLSWDNCEFSVAALDLFLPRWKALRAAPVVCVVK